MAEILSSNLSYENKIKYLNKNATSIFRLKESKITDINILHELFEKDKVIYTHDNLNYYWDLIKNNDNQPHQNISSRHYGNYRFRSMPQSFDSSKYYHH